MARSWLDAERKAWLRAEYSKRPVPETLRLFNRRFGTAVSSGQLKAANRNHRFGRARRSGASLAFSASEAGWLRERLPSAPRAEVATAFWERFGWRPKPHTLDNWAHRHGLTGAPNTGRFRAGQQRPPGSGATGPNSGSFRPGHKRNDEAPMHSERWRATDGERGCIFIKVPGPSPYEARRKAGWSQEAHWVRKAVWVWENARGPVPEGHRVVHLDGDPANCEIANLDCISGASLAALNRSGAPKFAGREANPARIRLAQLRAAAAARAKAAAKGGAA